MPETGRGSLPSQRESDFKRMMHSGKQIEELRGDPIGAGGSSRAFEVKGHPDQVLLHLATGFFQKTPENIKQTLEEGGEVRRRMLMLPENVQVARIIEVFVEDGEYYELQERAAGKPLHERKEKTEEWLHRLQLLAQAPLEQYQKLIEDGRAISEVGLQMDPSKPDNIFYDPEKGFTYIDLVVPTKEAKTYSPVVQLIYGYSRAASFTDEANEAIRTIIKKLREAGDVPESVGSSFSAIQTWMKQKKGTPEEKEDEDNL